MDPGKPPASTEGAEQIRFTSRNRPAPSEDCAGFRRLRGEIPQNVRVRMELTSTSVLRGSRQVLLGPALGFALILMTALAAAPAMAGELRVTLDAEAGVRSDGNYGQIAQTGEEAEDQELARAGLNLLLSWIQQDRFQIALGYSPSYERSLDDEELSGTAHRLDLALRGDLTRRLSLQLRERLLSSPNLDLYQPVIAGEPVAVPERGDQLLHSLDVSLNQELSRRFSFVVGANHSERSFEDEGLFDTETLSGRLGAAWRWTEEQVFEANASAGVYTYENDRETDVRTLGLTYQHPLGRDTLLRVEGGSFWVEASQPGRVITPPVDPDPVDPDAEPLPPVEVVEPLEESKTGWRGGVRLSQRRELFNWEVGYRHDVAPGYGLGRESEVDNGFVGISTNIGRRLTFGLDGNASRQREIIGDGDSSGVEERSLDFAAGTARATWAIVPAVRLTGGYSRIWQESKLEPFEDLSYDRFFLGLAFRIFSTGETPRSPEDLRRPGEEIDADEEPDAQ